MGSNPLETLSPLLTSDFPASGQELPGDFILNVDSTCSDVEVDRVGYFAHFLIQDIENGYANVGEGDIACVK